MGDTENREYTVLDIKNFYDNSVNNNVRIPQFVVCILLPVGIFSFCFVEA